MPVSGVVISCKPEMSAAIADELKKIKQLEVHHRLEMGVIIAVIETLSVDDEVALVKQITQSDGVLDVRLAYHNFEDLEELQS